MAEIMGWLWAALAFLGLAGSDGPLTRQGYVEAERLLIAAPLAARLESRDARRGMRVAAGDPLFRLDQSRTRAERAAAEAALAKALADLADLRQGARPEEIAVIRAGREQALAERRLAELRLAREQSLVQRRASSQDRLDEASADAGRLAAKVAELEAELEVALLPARADRIRAGEAEVAMAEAELQRLDSLLADMAPVAPAAALVLDTLFEPGEWVPADRPVVALLAPEKVKLRFFVPEPELGRLALGQELAFACDGCRPGQKARIDFIAPVTEYTPPVIYSRDSRQKLVVMVEARPLADPLALHPGQPVDVTLPP